jgi:glycosyltransferase involved in cell wall biosynthesis
MNPLFSIIIPVYNVAPELARAVNSVRMQNFSDWEIVLVDDGSSDGSGELCDQLSKLDSRIKVLHQTNNGVVAARYNGFAFSSGEWILFLDGDDEQEQCILEKLALIIATFEPDIIRFGFLMGKEGSFSEAHVPKIQEGMYSVHDLVMQAEKTPLEATEMCIWDKAYRRSVCHKSFEDVGRIRIKHSEDGLFSFAAFLHSKTFYVSHSIGVQYWLRTGSAVHRINKEIAQEKRIFIDKIYSLFRESTYFREDLIKQLKAYHSYEAIIYIYTKTLRWKATMREIYPIIRDIRRLRLLNDARPELENARRMIVAGLLSIPVAFLLYRVIFRIKRRAICE